MFRYIGSKASTVNEIKNIVRSMEEVNSVADAYGGLGTIGAALKSSGYSVSICDILKFPYAFQVARIECNTTPRFKKLLSRINVKNIYLLEEYLSNIKIDKCWFVDEYCKKRKFFTHHNGTRIAGAWYKICEWKAADLLSKKEVNFLMASLLNSMDFVANTAGTYYAFLKSMHNKALREFKFKLIPITKGNSKCYAYNGDALEVLSGKKFDLLYLDPPYNKRNYAQYYHLPEVMANFKEVVIDDSRISGVPKSVIYGTENIRLGTTIEYIRSIISNVKWKRLILHYSSNGYIPIANMRDMLTDFGNITEITVGALGYTSSTTSASRKAEHHVFLI